MSITAENVFDKIQHSFTIKTFINMGIESNFLNLIQNIYFLKTTGNSFLNDEELEAFSVRSGRRQECIISPFLLNIALEVLAKAM